MPTFSIAHGKVYGLTHRFGCDLIYLISFYTCSYVPIQLKGADTAHNSEAMQERIRFMNKESRCTGQITEKYRRNINPSWAFESILFNISTVSPIEVSQELFESPSFYFEFIFQSIAGTMHRHTHTHTHSQLNVSNF